MSVHTPVFWFRLLGLANWTLELGEPGVRINDQLWAWEDLPGCAVSDGWLWSTVDFDHGRIQLRGVSKTIAQRLLELSNVARPIRAAHSLIDQFLLSGYFASEYDRQLLVQRLEREIHWGDHNGPGHHLRHVPELERQYARVRRYIEGDRQELDDRNAEFVDAELKRWADWFAKVEKTP
jgi:hypothetical protein